MNCCICGNEDNAVLWCEICKHYFCGGCRWSFFHRGRDAVKQWLFNSPPKHCSHEDASHSYKGWARRMSDTT